MHKRSAVENYLRLSLQPTPTIAMASTTPATAKTELTAVAVKGTGPDATLELADGSLYAGKSFGAALSVAGECVFQTGERGNRAREWLLIGIRHGRIHRIPH